jgi:tRNA-intron endonuclease
MDISGELIHNQILVKKSSDIGRLYSKNHIGTLQHPKRLMLSLLEGMFLLDEGKMVVHSGKKHLSFSELLSLAVQHIPQFEIKYLVFKDLRNRGHAVTLIDDERYVLFRKFKTKNASVPSCVITAFSERDILDIAVTQQLVKQFSSTKDVLWFALVDEEGDLTYYNVVRIELSGNILEQRYPRGSCILLKNRLIVFDKKLSDQLLQKEFFGKPFGKLLQLSFVEGLYLLEKNILEIHTIHGSILTEEECIELMREYQPDIKQRLMVFKDLKQRGLLVKTGFKFGAHFRAYTKQPDQTHAEYLIHIVEKGFTSIWAEISRAVRLAHSVNKEFVFACIDGKTIDYIKLGRLRP